MSENIIEIPKEYQQQDEGILEQYRNQLETSTDNLVCLNSRGEKVCDFKSLMVLLGIVAAHEANPEIDTNMIKQAMSQLNMGSFMDILAIEEKHKKYAMPYGQAVNPPYEMFESFSSGILFTVLLEHYHIHTIQPAKEITNQDIIDDLLATLNPALTVYESAQEMLTSDDKMHLLPEVLEMLNNLGDNDGDDGA
ncbi:MAG: hypothetical protein CMB80_05760 [Flammeovirgaceae bacterium]|nr:hypothetical protein [Flammeovirgaceae bacterium]|tara:strand:- start:4725 stop:5306 length:582 start_codon:yes stop_codon:yes gene_type:complete